MSGAAALVLSDKYPSLTPDEVKKLLTTETVRIKGADDEAQGKGRLDLEADSRQHPSQRQPDATRGPPVSARSRSRAARTT